MNDALPITAERLRPLIESAAGGDAKASEQILQAFVKSTRLEKELRTEKIAGVFAQSRFVAERLTIPHDIAASTFGSSFDFEDGKPIANSQGQKLYSRLRPGEAAEFEEAIELLVNQRPDRDQILRRNGVSKPREDLPATQGKGGTVSRKRFDAMSPLERSAHFKAGGTIVD